MRTARWILVLVVAFAVSLTPLDARAAEISIVMRDLNNPRGLAFGPNGALYVAEAGRGGPQPCFASGPEGATTAGRTGSISRLWRGMQERVVTGLPSHAAPDGTGATGPHDVLVIGTGRLEITLGLGNDPAARPACGAIGNDLGWLARAHPNNRWQKIADIAGFEAAENPDRGIEDSNPYGLLAKEPGSAARVIATDAGGNTLLAIDGRGEIAVLAVLPSRSTGRDTDSVPTSVARGPDGALYVGELTGFPFTPGAANVWRIGPGGTPTIFRSGFTAIIDVAFGSDGSLYVLQFATGPFLSGPGQLVKVAPSGARTVIATGLVTPTSVAIGDDGAFYVSNCGVFPQGAGGPPPCQAGGGGHVLRIVP